MDTALRTGPGRVVAGGGVVVREGVAALTGLGGELDDLMDHAGVPITARRPWLTCWARCHDDWTPWLVGVLRGGRLRGAALLARQRRRGGTRIVALGAGASDYAALPVREPRDAVPLAAAVAAALRGEHRPWTAHLEQLPVGDPVVAALRARLPAAEIGPADPAVVVPIDPPGVDLRPAASARTRKNLRTAHGRIRRDGLWPEVRRIHAAADVRAALPEIARVRAAGNARMGVNDHAAPGERAFWGDILPLLAARGELEITEVRLDGALACYGVALLDGTAYRGWDTRIDPRFARYSPGLLMRDATREGLAGGPWTEFDMMRGTETYKSELPTRQRDLVELRAWSGQLLRLPRRARRRAAAVRDRHPRLIALDHRVRGPRRAS